MKGILSKIKRWSSKDLLAKASFEPFNSPDYKPTNLEPLRYLLEAADIEISNDGKRFEPKMTHKRYNHSSIAIKVLLETDPNYQKHSHVYIYLIEYISKTMCTSYGSGNDDRIHRVEVSYRYDDNDETLKYIYDILHILNHE